MTTAICRCGKTFERKHKKQIHCGRSCNSKAYAERSGRYAPEPDLRACANCGKQWRPKFKLAKYCSKRCQSTGYKRVNSQREAVARKRRYDPEKQRQKRARYIAANPDKYRTIWRLKQAKRNARLAGVAYEVVTAKDWNYICAAQGGRCWWCGERKALTLDHVVPVARGGPHLKSNIVAACSDCNTKKSANTWPLEGGALFGAVNRSELDSSSPCDIERVVHLRGSQIGTSVLDWTKVARIREFASAGVHGCQIARIYGISTSTACRVIAGKSWAHISCAVVDWFGTSSGR